MPRLYSYLRDVEGRWLASIMIALALLDVSLRLIPSTSTGLEAVRESELELFERHVPSDSFSSWVAERKAVKSAEAEKAAQALAIQEVVQAPSVAPEVFVDNQSGKLQQFRIGNLKYRLWGVFSVSADVPETETIFAVLRPDTGTSQVVAVGDVIGDYRVMSIEDRSVSFKATDSRVVDLELFERRG